MKRSFQAIAVLGAVLAVYDLAAMAARLLPDQPFSISIAVLFWGLLLCVYLAPIFTLLRYFPRPPMGMPCLRMLEGSLVAAVLAFMIYIPCLRFLSGDIPDALESFQHLIARWYCGVGIFAYFIVEDLVGNHRFQLTRD